MEEEGMVEEEIKNLRSWFDTAKVGVFKAASDKELIVIMIANI